MSNTAVNETAAKLQTLIREKAGLSEVVVNIEYDFPEATVPKEYIHEVLRLVKEDKENGFTFLTTLCGIHFPDKPGKEFWLMYQLHNLYTNERIRIYTHTSSNDLVMPTITDLWPAANWMEREAYDFYGFIFENHPNLIRILNVEDMDYHPMRKEYRLEDETRTDKDDSYFGR